MEPNINKRNEMQKIQEELRFARMHPDNQEEIELWEAKLAPYKDDKHD